MLLSMASLDLRAWLRCSWMLKINVGPGLELGDELIGTDDFAVLLNDPNDLNVHTAARNVGLLERAHGLLAVGSRHDRDGELIEGCWR